MKNKSYDPKKWTPCPTDCAYCRDPFYYGRPQPHPAQIEIREKESRLEKNLIKKNLIIEVIRDDEQRGRRLKWN